ncbi:MAG: tetratricopeptide repeat protein [Myxococcota bacterium]
MSTPRGKHEQTAADNGDAANDVGATLTRQTGETQTGETKTGETQTGSVKRAVVASDDDPPRVEGPASRASAASEDSAGTSTGMGSMPVPQFDDLVVAVEHAQVFEALFEMPARPQTLGRYVVLGPLGQGGMGTVFEAFDRTLDRRVAVKVLHQELDEEHTARLLREAQALAKLSHPNVVQVHEADTVGGQTFVVMELVQGQTLEAWMKHPPRPDWRQCVEVFIQVGQGLAAAHAAGLVHRDFKPSNAIVDKEGRARVLDFGLARRIAIDSTHHDANGRHTQGTTADDLPRSPPAPHLTMSWPPPSRAGGPPLDAPLTEAGTILGTPAYISPEQVSEQRADERSDQFSFCVSLYEAVYGQRPFEGNTLTKLMAAIKRDSVRPAPQGSPVPVRLRRLLLQGLALDPEKRWPSMDALLTQLRTLVAPPPRRRVALGMTVGLVGLGSVVAVPQVLELQQRCTGARAQMDGIWDDDRRQQVRGAILGTERSFALGTWERIEPQLDGYADTWVDTHAEVCAATSVRGEQSDEALDLRMRCLGQRRTALRATVDVLADANAEVVQNAVDLVAALPTLARCDDLSWLEQRRQLVPPPEDPDIATAVQAQRVRLAEIAAMYKAGRYAEPLDMVEAVVESAKALGYPQLWAEALYWRGELQHASGQYAQAEQNLRHAHALSVEHHHHQLALDTAQALSCLVGADLARHTEGRQWGEMTALPGALGSGDPLEEAQSLNNLLNVFQSEGDLRKVRDYAERALAIRQQVLDPDHPEIATSLRSLGNGLLGQGNVEEAQAYLEQALKIRQRALGPDHPYVAKSLSDLGNLSKIQGDLDKALLYHQRALALEQKALGPDNPSVATSLSDLGNVFLAQGDFEKARVHYQQALAIRHKVLGADHPYVAKSLGNLGHIFLSQRDAHKARDHYQQALVGLQKTLGADHPDIAKCHMNLSSAFLIIGDMDKARMHATRALTIEEEALGPDHPDIFYSLDNLGRAFFGLGDMDKAQAHYQRALATLDKALGPDHPDGAFSLVGLAKVATEIGDLASARAYAERAVSVREATTVAPQLLAEARFVLARTLWSTPSMRPRAHTLATQAQEALAKAGDPGESDVDLAEVEAWLATHRAA